MWHADILGRLSYFSQLKTSQCQKIWNMQGIVISFNWEGEISFIKDEAAYLDTILYPASEGKGYTTEPEFSNLQVSYQLLLLWEAVWMVSVPHIFFFTFSGWISGLIWRHTEMCVRSKLVEKFNLLQASSADLRLFDEPGELIPR